MLSYVFARARAEQRTVFIPYIMGGDPTIAASFEIVIELSALGAGIIELGIPFSDPIADGPTIAAAAQRALANGATVESTMQLAERCARAGSRPAALPRGHTGTRATQVSPSRRRAHRRARSAARRARSRRARGASSGFPAT